MAKFLIIWISIKIRSLFINFWREEAKIFKSSANKTMTRNYDRIAQIGIDRDRLFLAIEVCIISRERSAVCSGRGGRNCTPTRICNRTAERSTWQFYMALFSFRCFPANCMLPWHRLYLHFHVGPDLHWFAWNIVLQQREMRGEKRRGRSKETVGRNTEKGAIRFFQLLLISFLASFHLHTWCFSSFLKRSNRKWIRDAIVIFRLNVSSKV